MTIRNEQAENNLRTIGKTLSREAQESNEAETPIKQQHQRHSNFSEAQDNSESTMQKGRPRQSKNKFSRCLHEEFTNSHDHEKSESQQSLESLDQVNYGTQPDERRESYEDYDWEQERMIRYSRNDEETNCL